MVKRSKATGSAMVWLPFVPGDDKGGGDGGTDDSRASSACDMLALARLNLERLLDVKPFEAFWTAMLGDPACVLFFDSYLRHSQRWFDCSVDEACSSSSRRSGTDDRSVVQRLVLAALLRLLTDAPNAPSKQFHAALRDSKLMGPGQLVDVCTIYGEHNAALVRILAARALHLVPGLALDLRATLETLPTVLHQVFAVISTPTDPSNSSDREQAERQDMRRYILDIAVSLRCVLRAAGVAAVCGPRLRDARPLLGALCAFHTHCAAGMLGETGDDGNNHNSEDNATLTFAEWRANVASECVLDCVYLLLNGCCLAPLGLSELDIDTHADVVSVTQRADQTIEVDVEEVLSVVGELASDEDTGTTFALSAERSGLFDSLYSLTEGDHNVDATRLQYLRDMSSAAAAAASASNDPFGGPEGKSGTPSAQRGSKAKKHDASKRRSRKDVQTKVRELQDVLPHVGAYFAERLLKVLDFDVQRAAQSMFEGDLPVEVRGIDTDAQQPPGPQRETLRPLDRGPDNMADLLNQMADPKRRRARGDGGKEVEDESSDNDDNDDDDGDIDGYNNDDIDDGGAESQDERDMRDRIKKFVTAFDMYEDEYDDALDGAAVLVNDQGTWSEADGNGPGGREWRPGMADVDGVKRDRDGKPLPEDKLLKPNQNHLVTPPAGRGGRGGGGRRGGRSFGRGGSASAAGDGASANGDAAPSEPSLRQRARNERNKSSRANHSRKRGAAKKAGKGMF